MTLSRRFNEALDPQKLARAFQQHDESDSSCLWGRIDQVEVPWQCQVLPLIMRLMTLSGALRRGSRHPKLPLSCAFLWSDRLIRAESRGFWDVFESIEAPPTRLCKLISREFRCIKNLVEAPRVVS